MPELTVTVRVPLPKQPTLACLEQAVFKALQPAGRELLLEAFGLLEQQTLDGAKQRRRRRYLITRFGEIRFFRWQTRTEAGYGYPLDEALGIGSGDPCSPWVRQTASWLAQAHPFRQAARLLSKMIGTRVDHRTLWGWVQGSGRAVRRHLEQLRASLFDDGEDPAFQGWGPEDRLDLCRRHVHPNPRRSRRSEARHLVDRSPSAEPHRLPPPLPAPGQGLLCVHPGSRPIRPDVLRPCRPKGRDRQGPGGVLHLRRCGVVSRPAGRLDRAHRLPARPVPRQAQDLRGREGIPSGRPAGGHG